MRQNRRTTLMNELKQIREEANNDPKLREDADKNERMINIKPEEITTLKCPKCHKGDILYHNGYGKGQDVRYGWICSACSLNMAEWVGDIFSKNRDKVLYQLYRKYGVEAISELTGESLKNIKTFIGNYFKSCCATKKEACIYYKQLNTDVKATIAEINVWRAWNKFESKNAEIQIEREKLLEGGKNPVWQKLELELGYYETKVLKYITRTDTAVRISDIWNYFNIKKPQAMGIINRLIDSEFVTTYQGTKKNSIIEPSEKLLQLLQEEK